MDEDYLLALSLQFNEENQENTRTVNNVLDDTIKLTDPEWELVDPTPDIYSMFMQFDKKFFWNALQAVSIGWSKKMTTCAGVCTYHGHRSGLCHISLSEPLLKLRPRKDLIETLLHEMIHAYLFVTKNNKDHDGHGPEFHKHMNRINARAGTNISVYHSFHDEVNLYKTHWWRCNGPCQNQKPFFGIVKRAMNRKPGPNDFWWESHKARCSGEFIKIREPDSKTKKKELATKSVPINIITNYLTKTTKVKEITKSKSKPIESNSELKNETKIGGTNKINTLSDLNELDNNSCRAGIIIQNPKSPNLLRIDNFKPFSSKGFTLSTSSTSKSSNDLQTSVRDARLKRFENNNKSSFSSSTPKKLENVSTSSILKRIEPIPSTSKDVLNNNDDIDRSSNKKIRLEDNSKVNCPVCKDLILEIQINDHLTECLSSFEDVKDDDNELINCLICDEQIVKNNLKNHLEICTSGIFDENNSETNPLDNSNKGDANDDLDNLTDSINKTSENSVVVIENEIVSIDLTTMPDERDLIKENRTNLKKILKPGDLLVECPNCPLMMLQYEINDHLDLCISN